jgi:hypothetical protein
VPALDTFVRPHMIEKKIPSNFPDNTVCTLFTVDAAINKENIYATITFKDFGLAV